MNQAQEARARRNYVSNMYDGPRWKERVATMPSDQITAIFLRAKRDEGKPKLLEKPEPPKQEEQFKLF